MNFDKIFEVIDHLYESRKQDEILMELVSDFYKYAIEYTEYNLESREAIGSLYFYVFSHPFYLVI